MKKTKERHDSAPRAVVGQRNREGVVRVIRNEGPVGISVVGKTKSQKKASEKGESQGVWIGTPR